MPPPTTTSFTGAGVHASTDEVGEHRDERGVVIGGGRAVEADAHLRRHRRRLDVEVVQDLDVVADKADRRDHDVRRPERAKSRIAAPMSGSSHGSRGEPLRLW